VRTPRRPAMNRRYEDAEWSSTRVARTDVDFRDSIRENPALATQTI
jgi:hypothetical protein